MRQTVVFSLVIIVLGSAAPALAQSAAAAPGADKGAAVFAAQKCSMCYSLDGKRMAKGPLDSVGSKLTAEWITHPVEMAKANATRKPLMKALPKKK